MNLIIERIEQLAKKIEDQVVNGRQHVDSYRVFHGRGQTFPGLEFITVDYFQPVILVTLFAEPPQGFLASLVAKSRDFFDESQTVFLVQRRYLVGAPSETIWGDLPEQCFAYRGDLRFSLHLGQQQNSGFFLDMEPGRAWLEQQAQGKRILNLFSYTCAFSVVAVAADATGVVNVDMSSAALNHGRGNHQLNGLDKSRSEFLAENILKSWGRIKKRGPYNLVIIDPPTYQKGSFIAEKDYAKVVRRLPELMPEGGVVLACLNAPELSDAFLRQVFIDNCPSAQFVERLRPHPNFPDVDAEQQLKLLVYRLPVVDQPE